MTELSQNRLKEIFDYSDGLLFWKEKRRGSRRPVAGCLGTHRDKKRRHICIDGSDYLSSRLIYLYHHGRMPKSVDHIDRNTENDRVENLREATPSQQIANQDIKSNNKSGYRGVCWDKSRGKWISSIRVKGKRSCLGRFESPEDAAIAYNEAANKFFGEFAFTNSVHI